MTSDLETQKGYLRLLAAGLSQEEAELILRRRTPRGPVHERLAKALSILSQSQAKVGVAPVSIGASGDLEKSELPDPEAAEKFWYSKGGGSKPHHEGKVRVVPTRDEDQSQDPEDH